MTDNELPPSEAFDAAAGILEEHLERAQQAIGDGTTVEYQVTSLAAAVTCMATQHLRQLAAHRPSFKDGAWVCPSCAEVTPVLGMVHATSPCAVALSIFDAVMGGTRVESPAPGGMRFILQDGSEPYVSLGAAELERMCGLPPDQARQHSSAVVQAISRVRRRSRHH